MEEDNAIDAVGFVRQIRDELYEKTKDMSTDELIAFYRQHAAAAKTQLSRSKAEHKEPSRGRR